jgi:NADH-quinone oxidoreductase subunit M
MSLGSLLILISILFGVLGLKNDKFAKFGSIFQLILVSFLIKDPKPETYSWGLGVTLSFDYDNVSLFLIGLASIFCAIAKSPLILLSHGAVVGAFASRDLFSFFIFFEAMLLPIYFAIKGRSGLKFLLYSTFGGALFLGSILYVAALSEGQTGSISFLLPDLARCIQVSHEAQAWLFWGFFIAFAIKTPIFPFHGWQADAYRDAPISVTTYMAAVLSKVGIYGMFRFVFPLFPAVSYELSSFLSWIAVLGSLYAGFIAFNQTDIRRALAFASMSHLGIAFFGVAAWNANATSGVMFHLIAHGLTLGGLFLCVEKIEANRNSKQLSVLMFALFMSFIAVPLTAGFVGEFVILSGSYRVFPLQTTIVVLGVVVSAAYSLKIVSKHVLIELELSSVRELIVIALLALSVLGLGVYPNLLLEPLQDSVKDVLVSSSEREAVTLTDA